jgi:hypothetical protein
MSFQEHQHRRMVNLWRNAMITIAMGEKKETISLPAVGSNNLTLPGQQRGNGLVRFAMADSLYERHFVGVALDKALGGVWNDSQPSTQPMPSLLAYGHWHIEHRT